MLQNTYVTYVSSVKMFLTRDKICGAFLTQNTLEVCISYVN